MRGQAATEYILVSATALLIVVPSIFFFYQFSQNQANSFESSQILRIGDRLALNTQTVFNGGLNTRTTLTEQFPEGLVNITFFDNPSAPGGEYFIYFDPTYSGEPTIYGFPVNVPVSLDTENSLWGEGQRRIRLDVLDNDTNPGQYYVNVTVS